MNDSTLTVTMTSYNHAQYIGEALEAILRQSFKPVEVIVVDDCSTDNSVEIIQEFVRQYPTVRLIRNKQNMGPVLARNRALGIALGDYVYNAASDDKVLPGFFEKSMKLLAQYPQAGGCSARVLLIDEQGKEKGELDIVPPIENTGYLPPERVLTELRKSGEYIVGNTAIYKRTALIELGGLIPELRAYCDRFIAHAIALKYGACFIPEPLAAWRRMDTGYAASMSARTDIALEAVSYAVKLMQSPKYSSLFPQDYIRDWQQGQLYALGQLIFKRLRNHQNDFLTDLGSLRIHPMMLDKVFLKGLRIWICALSRTIMLYLLYRRLNWPLLVRKLKELMCGNRERDD